MSGEIIRVAICVASSGQCRTWFASSLAGFIGAAQTLPFWPQVESVETTLLVQESSVIHGNREALIKAAIEWNATHILFMDDDMVFVPVAIASLFSRRHPIVITNYPKRGFPLTGTAATIGGKIMDSTGRTGIEEAYYGGFGLALIETKVFKDLPQPWFLPRWSEEHKIYTTEDLPFYEAARKAGYRVWVDHDASNMIGHHGSYTFAWPKEVTDGK
jgi:hypothetical protein